MSHLVRAILRLYPRRFRELYGDEMLEVLDDLKVGQRPKGRWQRWRSSLQTLVSLLLAALSERLEQLRETFEPPPPSKRKKGASAMSLLLADLRYGARMLLKQRITTITATVLLGLGIGANTAIFSLVDTLLFRSLPRVEEPSRLVAMFTSHGGSVPMVTSYMDYRDFERRCRSFSDLAAYKPLWMDLSGGGSTERVQGLIVTEPFFRLLGVEPALGRFFLPGEDAEANAAAVAVLGHELWRGRFGGDPEIVGSTVHLNGRAFTVVGVAPQGFRGASLESRPQLFAPMMMQPHFMPTSGNLLERRGWGGTLVIGRLADGVSIGRARGEVQAVGGAIVEEFPAVAGGREYTLVPLLRGIVYPQSRRIIVPMSMLLFGIVGAVLLVACVNVARLQLSRASLRRREIAVRRALGANRNRLLRQLLLESLLLALLGGLAGVVIARLLVVYLASLPLPFELDLALDARVLGSSLILALLTGVLVGLVPALRSTRLDLSGELKDAPATGRGPRGILVRGLTIAQVAASCCLLVLAGLFARSLVNLVVSDPGFSPESTLVATLDPSLQGYDEVTRIAFYERVMEQVRALPGVASASLVNALPGPNNDNVISVGIDGYVASDERQPLLSFNLVGLDYFETLRIPLREGRTFLDNDDRSGPPVVVINEMAARYLRELTGRDALGARMNPGGSGSPWIEVVGVVADSKTLGLRSEPHPTAYRLHRQASGSSIAGRMTLVVRTEGEPLSTAPAVRGVVRSLDPNLPVVSVGTLEQHLQATLVQERLSATLLLAAALLALLLAAVGLYGLLASSVSQRTAEIGLRMALGAAGGDLVRWVVREGLFVVSIGVAIGLGLAAGATSLASGFFYGVGRLDPVTWLGVFVVMSLVSLLASYLPARRATRVDPVIALRNE